MSLSLRLLVSLLAALLLAASVAFAGGSTIYADKTPDGTLGNIREIPSGVTDAPRPGCTLVELSARPTSEGPWTYDAVNKLAVPVRTGKADGSVAGTKAALAVQWLQEEIKAEADVLAATAAKNRLVTLVAPVEVLAAAQAQIDAAERRATAAAMKLKGL